MTRPRGLLIGSFGLLLTGLALGCAESDSCQDYADYICECHADDPSYDCDALQTTYEDADDSLQDECSIALASVENQDEQDGTGCVTEDTGGSDTGGTGTGSDDTGGTAR